MRTEEEVYKLLNSLQSNEFFYGSSTERKTAIKVLSWVLENKPEVLNEI